jgi:D-alanine-D-alanine ligase
MNIAVLLGGFSAERDVSLASGLRIAAALRERGHLVTCVDPAAIDARGVLGRVEEARLLAAGVGARRRLARRARRARLRTGGHPPGAGRLAGGARRRRVLPRAHGGQGRTARCRRCSTWPACATGSGHLASALAMDKHLSKVLFRAAGVGTADWRMARASTRRRARAPALRRRGRRGARAAGDRQAEQAGVERGAHGGARRGGAVAGDRLWPSGTTTR